jgi:hypothetical protein
MRSCSSIHGPVRISFKAACSDGSRCASLARLAEDMQGAGRAATLERMRRRQRRTAAVVVACLPIAATAVAQDTEPPPKPEPFSFAD